MFARHRLSNLNNDAEVPLSLRAIGSVETKKGWEEFSESFKEKFMGIFWCEEGKGEFIYPNGKHILTTDNVLIYYNRSNQIIRAKSEVFKYKWFTFDGIIAEDFFRSFAFPEHPFYAGKCPENLFLEMTEILKTLSFDTSLKGAIAIHKLLWRIKNPPKKNISSSKTIVKNFKNIVSERYNDENINVNIIANILGVHRITLNTAVKEEINSTPGKYISTIRLQKALQLLQESEIPISDVAKKCGLPSATYFSRFIKRHTGKKPHEFRR
jgi:AraC-like DNA-binding protein